MELKNLKIKGLKIIKSKIYRDKRGYLREIFKNKILKDHFIFDVMSYSKKKVLSNDPNVKNLEEIHFKS